MGTTRCERMLPLIVRAADGSLSAAERGALDEHAAGCAACREALAAQTAVARTLAEMPSDHGPADFAARVRARLERPPILIDLFNWRAWTLRLAPVAALLALLSWLPSADRETWTLAAAEEAWAAAGMNGDAARASPVPPGMLFDADVDGYDLLAAALEVPPQ